MDICKSAVCADYVRRVVRGFLKYDSGAYRFGSSFLNFISISKKEGFRAWLMLRRAIKGKNGPGVPVQLSFRSLRYPIFVRPGTEDVNMIINDIIREEYGQFETEHDPIWVIDAGAYIGDTSAYFLSRFPKAKVIALEPNPPTYEMASQNLKPYAERAVLLKMGLSESQQTLKFGGSFGGASIQETGIEIECTSIPALLERYSIPRVSILKMDIEGAEKMVFLTNPEAWLDRIDMMMIEIHGKDIEEIIFSVLKKNNFSFKQYRSVWYCYRSQ